MEAKTSNNAEETAQLTVKQAGARGGSRTLERYGREFFQTIGKKGGKRTAELHRKLLSDFSRRGGRPRRPALDEHMGSEAGE